MCVPMDGFHLANAQLQHLGRADRKGAPDTFDVRGYIALLGRLRANEAPVIYAPEFQRRLDEPIAGAIAVPREITLVITEGNYLLLEESPWDLVRGLLDEVWYLDLDDWDRTERLVSRHVRHGKPPPEALEWVRKSDDLNAALVARTRDRADMVVTSLNLP
jgi:pantothenate kinase